MRRTKSGCPLSTRRLGSGWSANLGSVITGFFDADCGFCSKSVDWAKALRPDGFVWVPYGSADGLLESAGFAHADRKNFVVAVSSNLSIVARGPEVFWLVLERQTRLPRLQGFGRLVARLAKTKFGSGLSWFVYRAVASRRLQLSGRNSSCQL